jgi:predicted anti-sigma-YlaC factor YlaD
MDCTTAREAISARLDGEPSDVEPDLLEAHLAGCPACRAWREQAHQITRRARLVPARASSPSEALLAAVAATHRGPAWWRSTALIRGGLVTVALAQIAVTVPALIFGTDRDAPIHVAHEMGSFDMALAVGFLAAAWAPTRAQGMRTLVGAAALLLVVTATIDLIAGRTSLSDEAPHLLTVAGWLLLRRLALLAPPNTGDRAVSPTEWLRRRSQPAPVAHASPPAGDDDLRIDITGDERVAAGR